MSALLALRQELVAALDGLDLNLYTHIPGRMALPGAWVQAGNPYIEQGQTLGDRTVRFAVVLAVQVGDNDSETSALDDLIEAAQAALEADGWLIERVEQPFSVTFGNATGLTTAINVATPATFN